MSSARSRSFVTSVPSNAVVVRVSSKALYNFESMQQITKEILGRVGCPGCHSGLDIRFVLEEQEFLVDEQMNIHAGPGGAD